jgi:hypothetical protein
MADIREYVEPTDDPELDPDVTNDPVPLHEDDPTIQHEAPEE